MNLAIVLGCRPEAIKLAPVVREALRRHWDVTILNTGQHRELFDQTGFADEFPVTCLNTPNLGVPEQFVDEALSRLELWSEDEPERVILVQGDTASAYAGAHLAYGINWPLVHLEAGLRTGDHADPFPEEGYRTTIDAWSDLRLAPTPKALHVLLNDKHKRATNVLVGNTVVDALRALQVVPSPAPLRPRVVLVTLHRRESWGEHLKNIVSGLRSVALETENRHGYVFRWPAHLSPAVQQEAQRVKDLTASTRKGANFRIEPPLEYPRFVRTLAYCKAVVTDSGGVVEEAATLGVPCVITRDKTERMEAVESGQAILAGRTSKGVADAVRQVLAGQLSSTPSSIFGDGHAAEASCDAMERAFG
ncbi:MAG: UDP-N-acetylglucosamine 2-epimerase (non-hydrolyzing) [Candidatus Paceibacterota bacterium]|jgi:UDP-N-acetylglucosamine 2-epimerase (non-hydrolysing)